ncbi:MAG: hypothetical protein KDA78_19990 [Planctomycetaceae bacterium]|nr:hypothetical protein [Planctomycetaceae bacterium]
MAYWDGSPAGNDYAFVHVGVYVSRIQQQMFEDIENVIEKSYPEQSVIASLQCIRLLASEFSQGVSGSFRKKQFQQAKDKFYEWYEKVHTKIPSKYREDVLKSAEVEFERFEQDVLKINKGE